MKRYGLIGEKLGHSYSKIIHEQLADYTYDLIPLSKEEFAPFMEKHKFTAINVTIPYKQDVIPYLDEISEAAQAIGAVNCIVNKNGRLCGHNTDYAGFLYTLRNNNIRITGEKVLVLGNGGAAKAIVAALNSLNPKELITVKYKEEPGVITYEQSARMHTDASVIVNTSPVGMYPNIDASPMDIAPYEALNAVVDLIYNPTTTKLLAQAKERGITAVNGLEMLVAQAKYAVELFLDTEIPDKRIEEVTILLRRHLP
ncbi:MAG: shikimate dehydrogenase [Lachnospiraceae bacterium]|nr:shikimate dehydrogenase [Lachnospiraceae bacterium]